VARPLDGETDVCHALAEPARRLADLDHRLRGVVARLQPLLLAPEPRDPLGQPLLARHELVLARLEQRSLLVDLGRLAECDGPALECPPGEVLVSVPERGARLPF